MPGPLRLFLVRHGEAHSNREMRYLGSSDEVLTEVGEGQAERLATALAGLPIATAYASPLRRAAQTGERIAARLGLTLQLDDRLREQGFGEWEGFTRAEVLGRGPVERDRLLSWETDPSIAPPGGESMQLLATRLDALLHDLTAAHPQGWIVLVSHVGPIKALLCAALGAPLTSSRRLFLDPGSLSVVDWGESPVVRLFNAHDPAVWREARWMRR
jgi:probable phosphoglycerate mutase